MQLHGSSGGFNEDLGKRIHGLPPRLTPEDIVLPEDGFAEHIPKFTYNGRRHVVKLLAYLKHMALERGNWSPKDDGLPFEERCGKLFEVNDVRSICDAGSGPDCNLMIYVRRLAGEGVRAYAVDSNKKNPGITSVTYVQGNIEELDKLLAERPEFEGVRRQKGFDIILSNATISPGGMDMMATARWKPGLKMSKAIVDSLNDRPGSFALITPFESVVALSREDADSIAKVKYWCTEDFPGFDTAFPLGLSHGFRANAVILEKKR
ncbi:MAG: hypothetical protein ABIH11_08955 [Candidatus Altiarchaeota archaeon]